MGLWLQVPDSELLCWVVSFFDPYTAEGTVESGQRAGAGAVESLSQCFAPVPRGWDINGLQDPGGVWLVVGPVTGRRWWTEKGEATGAGVWSRSPGVIPSLSSRTALQLAS